MVAEPSQKRESLAGPAFWLMCAKALAFVFSFALPLLLVRRLDQHEFGLYKQVFLVVGTAITTLPLGFATSAFYFLPRERQRQRQVIFNILLFNITVGGLACLTLIAWPDLLATVFNGPELARFAPLIGPVILLWCLATVLETIAVAHQEARLATAFIIAAQFSKTSLLLGAAVFFGSVRALICAAMIHGLIQAVLLLGYARSRFRGFWRGFDASMLRTQLAYSLPFGFAGLLYSVQMDLHNYFVSNRFGPAAFAIYAVGCFQLPLVGILGESVNSVLIPRVSLLHKEDNRREIVRLIARVMRKLAMVYFPVYGFLMVMGREFISGLFTEQYLASWPIFAVNLTLLPFSVLMVDPIVRAYAEQRYFVLRLRACLLTLLLVTLWFGTRHLGLVGTIAVVVAFTLTDNLVVAIRALRLVGVTRRDLFLVRDVGKLALAAASASLAAALVRTLVVGGKPLFVLVACAPVFVLVYLAVIVLLGVPTLAERASIRRRLARFQAQASWRRAVDTVA